MQIKNNDLIVQYDDEVAHYLTELIDILLKKEYFSFADTAKRYVSDMKNYIKRYIAVLPAKTAPPYFNKYKKGMKYITYPANKQTIWYIFFKQKDNRFMVYYITNNHFEGQYIR
jgi:predicted 2-oxoglutarate/Fe(II)-dependent dioxygenase YbiX